MKVKLQAKKQKINTELKFKGDKSIAHRALIIGALAKGNYKIYNFPQNEDCCSTLNCMRKLGVDIQYDSQYISVTSPGFENFSSSVGVLDAGNSGTTVRLMSGLLTGRGIEAQIVGDASLSKRPMGRVILPLSKMGARILSENSVLPLNIKKTDGLIGINYEMPVDSAQVKSSVLIAGFLAENHTTVLERNFTRDHTEKMFKALGADIQVSDKSITIKKSKIEARDMYIPGDISSAAFLIAASLLSEDATIRINNILLNQRRRAYLDILIHMGANIEYRVTEVYNGEETGYIKAASSSLKGVNISKEVIPNIIDEIPMLAVLAAFSNGKTVFEGIAELKYKESNRIEAVAENFKAAGLNIQYSDEHMEVIGDNRFINKELIVKTFGDHRIALAFAAMSVRNKDVTIIDNWECTNISFPDSLKYFSEFLNITTCQ
ncbi:3-phosphoshikimate 1-carboxyvinyltransferase [Clostridiales bacterium oral taxon 876 str. F0540]|nr:3-phosphoshikimate 1-carboxyvinyltransferase [Clostridiales bacterium oral taxon 876 str. F0540]